jgi:hypothetical protein
MNTARLALALCMAAIAIQPDGGPQRRDGTHYVEAAFALTQPSLPVDPRATGDKARDPGRAYLRRNETQLAGFNEASFTPPLGRLRALVRSIAVEGDGAK